MKSWHDFPLAWLLTWRLEAQIKVSSEDILKAGFAPTGEKYIQRHYWNCSLPHFEPKSSLVLGKFADLKLNEMKIGTFYEPQSDFTLH